LFFHIPASVPTHIVAAVVVGVVPNILKMVVVVSDVLVIRPFSASICLLEHPGNASPD